ncbi:class I SAM-dependent methyltransferase [Desulfopila sp. IMCC35008]|uniref:class I SAM-dependent methyltransferase n=1 Tax=Desulfopila sp. IMCC35008 TaxID=2653858 RepID=UPI0013D31BC1|nr:class I SAM-dependent methyltransferase [Desulfopila sp. IMCC35008]
MPQKAIVSVSCTSVSISILQKAKLFAKNNGLTFFTKPDTQTPYSLHYTDELVELIINGTSRKTIRPKPLSVDFEKGDIGYRHHQNLTIRQPLAKAVGISSGKRPLIFDATAGLGGDSFVFASLGCKVLLCERSPIIAALLDDGLLRALQNPESIGQAAKRMQLYTGDAKNILATFQEKPHTIYFDPMYPHSKKTALNRIEMRVIRDLVGEDDDSDETLRLALQHAGKRVVVKRPKGAEHVANLKPTHTTAMKNSRFDVYLTPYL